MQSKGEWKPETVILESEMGTCILRIEKPPEELFIDAYNMALRERARGTLSASYTNGTDADKTGVKEKV